MPKSLLTTIIDENTQKSALAGAGGKAVNLHKAARQGFAIPKTLYVHERAYRAFIQETGLAAQIQDLLARDMDALRWEEIWDVSLSIRNLFMREAVPDSVAQPILQATAGLLGDASLAVRSCASHEDSIYSHAGLHDSVLHVQGGERLLKAVTQVWASLWSDRALLYRREMGLDPGQSAMGVLIQGMAIGDFSGVLFTADPTDETRLVIEAAPGLADAVVSDAADAERIVIDRQSGNVLERKTSDPKAPLLSNEGVAILLAAGRQAEQALGGPQDMEWTLDGGRLVILQSRPITTLMAVADKDSWKATDKRPWYLSLTRSFADMQGLHARIVHEILPGMLAESESMRKTRPGDLGCEALSKELWRRRERLAHWRGVYWGELIPFAHAVRLFGMLYNDAVAPADPFEFTQLLTGQGLLAVERNNRLKMLAKMIREDPGLQALLEQNTLPQDGPFMDALGEFMNAHGDLACSTAWCHEGPWGVIRLAMSDFPLENQAGPKEPLALEAAYLNAFDGERRDFAEQVLELARQSYRLRDDDNLYLGKIQARFEEALEEAKRRVQAGQCRMDLPQGEEKAQNIMPKGHGWQQDTPGGASKTQIRGWPASVGIGRGKARVITSPDRLFAFQKGEVLVCDALDPNMTFVAPLASAIVERRGGMLVHGAIIAREYGIPCVTGIPDATRRFQDGDELVVDGFRGVVIHGNE